MNILNERPKDKPDCACGCKQDDIPCILVTLDDKVICKSTPANLKIFKLWKH